MNYDFKMLLNYRRMRNIKRCNTFPNINPEDVAQHSFYVAILAMSLADEYNTWVDEHNLEFHPLDDENQYDLVKSELVLRKALLHDTEEAITSDIPWNIKHMNSEVDTILSKAINERLKVAYEGTTTMDMYRELCKDCKDGLEGKFVAVADMLELALYCKEECLMGNTSMIKMLDKCINLTLKIDISSDLQKSSPLFNSILTYLSDEKVEWSEYIDID